MSRDRTLIKINIDGLKLNNDLTVITGDMNVNINGVHENNNKYLNMLSESAFISFINVYARLLKGFNHSCLDHILINSNENVVGKINADIMDQCTICISIPINANVVNNRKMFTIIDYNLITSILANEKWTEVYDASDVNSCYDVFDKIIKKAIDKSTTQILLKSKNKRLKEWMTNGLLISTQTIFLIESQKTP